MISAAPMTPLEKPGYLQSVQDPEFGSRIIRISDSTPADGENAVCKPIYSTQGAWNADESLLLLWRRGGNGRRYQLLDGRTYKWLGELPLPSTDIEGLLWDPINPDALYFPCNVLSPPSLLRYTPSTGKLSVQRAFTEFPGSELALGADPGSMSWGMAGVLGLMCGQTKFTYSIGLDKILATAVTGDRIVPMAGASGARLVWWGQVYDYKLQRLFSLGLNNPGEHASLGWDPALQYGVYNTVVYDVSPGHEVGSLVSFSLLTGLEKVIIGPATGWPYPPGGTHISSCAWKAPGKVAVSIVGERSGQGVLDQELLVADVGTGEVQRVAHHRSWAGEGPWGYWGEPHAGISPSGTRVVFGSDWGGGASVDAYVVEL